MGNLNVMWERIARDHKEYAQINEIDAPSLKEAAQKAICSDNVKYAFRMNRELIDITGNFRLFLFYNKPYVVKIIKTKEIPIEYINARKANKILSDAGVTEFYVPIPQLIYSNDSIGLLTQYYGHSLYEDCKKTAQQFSQKKFALGFRKLLELGIEWEGWLPRNILLHEDQLILIDWEKAIFNKNASKEINSITLFKLILGWSQIYGSLSETEECFMSVLEGFCFYDSDFDEFEAILINLFELKDERLIRSKGISLTFDSEGPSDECSDCILSFMDIGHIIDEIYSIHISVWYTCCSGMIREQKGDKFFLSFLQAFINAFILALRSSGAVNNIYFSCHEVRNIELLLILYLFGKPEEAVLKNLALSESINDFINILENTGDMSAYLIKYLKLRNMRGLKNAVERSQNMQIFLELLYDSIKKISTTFQSFDLLLRGSCGQKIMTVRSDVDFEISGPSYPNGFGVAENIIGEILDVFGIDNENSRGRPEQKDIHGPNGITRDYHEWTELTKPNKQYNDRGWLTGKFTDIEDQWMYYSEYERKSNEISPKYLFFRLRALIIRLAQIYKLRYSSITMQLYSLNEYLSHDIYTKLNFMLRRTLELYEVNENMNECLTVEIMNLNDLLDCLYRDIDIKFYKNIRR